MSTVIFFCEGNEDSYDRKVFEKLLSITPKNIPLLTEDEEDDNTKIIPINNKGYIARYIEGYKKNTRLYDVNDTFYVGFRDRDFDIPVPNSCELTHFAGSEDKKLIIFAGYRTTIENYLLSPAFFEQFIHSPQYTGAKMPQINEQDCIELFNDAAKSIRYHQAARHALGKIVREGIPQISSNFLKKISPIQYYKEGQLPLDLSKEFCLSEGKKNLERYQSKSSGINETKFETNFDEYTNAFDDDFVSDISKYMAWFNGKNLAVAIRNKHNHLDFKAYYRFVMEKIDENPNFLHQFPDLLQLKNKIMEYSNN